MTQSDQLIAIGKLSGKVEVLLKLRRLLDEEIYKATAELAELDKQTKVAAS